jgi:multiple sugar transport system substrate-binding protein
VPNGVQNDVMSWLWASGGSMLTPDGKPNLTSAPVKATVEYVKSLNDAGVIAPGSLTMKEQDKVEKFTTGQVGMVIDSLAHITLIKKNNPKLNFTVAAIPAEDGFTGPRGIPYASWGIGIAESTKHKAEAFKLVSYLMSQQVNSQMSTLANGFPGTKGAEPDLSKSDPLFKTALRHLQQGQGRQRVHRAAEVRGPDAQLRRAAPARAHRQVERRRRPQQGPAGLVLGDRIAPGGGRAGAIRRGPEPRRHR